jgi:transcriptional regulator with XRE-family HTH domain
MQLLSTNIKFLRKSKDLTQAEFALKIGVNRSVIGAYEEGRAEPKLQTLQAMSEFFNLRIDNLVNQDLSQMGVQEIPWTDVSGQNLRVLPISIDPDSGLENMPLVPEKAAAGYATGYSDVNFIGNLPQFNMPFPELRNEKTYRIFQIQGESMLPIPSGSYIISEYLHDWKDLKDDLCYIILTRDEGIIYKRVKNLIQEKKALQMISDNPDFEPYDLPVNNILEVWKALGYTCFDLPDRESDPSTLHQLFSAVTELKRDIKELRSDN